MKSLDESTTNNVVPTTDNSDTSLDSITDNIRPIEILRNKRKTNQAVHSTLRKKKKNI